MPEREIYLRKNPAKHELRQQARLARRLARERGGAAAAQALREHLLPLVLAEIASHSGAAAALYWPTGDEMDVRPLLESLVERDVPCALPRMLGRDKPLGFFAFRPGDPLVPGRHGIFEPGLAAPELRPGLLLMPLLAFDGRGHRLGYGAGYYDRTLMDLRSWMSPPLAIGVAYAAQEVDQVPTDDHDQPLDGVATELGLRRLPE